MSAPDDLAGIVAAVQAPMLVAEVEEYLANEAGS